MHCISRKDELQSEPKNQGVHSLLPLSPGFIPKVEQELGDLSAVSTFYVSKFSIRAQKSHDNEELHDLTLHQIFHLPL